MAKSVLRRLTPQDLIKLRGLVAYDPTIPNGLRWLVKRKGKKPSETSQTLWIDYVSYQASNVVMILNERWPSDGDSVVTRIDKNESWGEVDNLKWSSHGDAMAGARDRCRQKLLQKVFGDDVPDLGDRLRLASLCKRGHQWNGHPVTLQFKDGANWRCKECDRENDASPAAVATRRAWYEANREKLCKEAKERAAARRADPVLAEADRQRQLTPERAENRRLHKAKIRQSLKAQGLTTRGTEPVHTPEKALKRQLERAIRSAGRSSIPRLVMNEQLRYWRENPKDRAEHDRQWDKYIYSWRYKVDPSFRRHECQRNSEKKARNRGNHTVKLCRGDIDARFAEFNNQCAFCGSGDRLIIEHFIPRSKGGPHAIGNILPACHDCNMSKFNHDPEEWYRSRPYFSETRWRKILRVLGKGKAAIHQLPLL